jgi:ABC-type dipeptide/oligopeptide/nickel transport system permease subunit
MLNEARDYLVRYPHLAIFPGLAIFLAVYSFNMLGDALRDVLDPAPSRLTLSKSSQLTV